jgi:hypothetical protein
VLVTLERAALERFSDSSWGVGYGEVRSELLGKKALAEAIMKALRGGNGPLSVSHDGKCVWGVGDP